MDPFGYTQGRDAIMVKALVKGWMACCALPFTRGAGALNGDARLRRRGQTVPSVKKPEVEAVTVVIPLDPFLSLRALAAYSGLSVRKLRDYLDDPSHPLPHYRVGGKILVRRSEFDIWIAAYRRVGDTDVDRIVAEVLTDLD